MPAKTKKTENRKRAEQSVLQQIRRSAAYHEAGHAVTHYMLGEQMEFVRMDVHEDTLYLTDGNWAVTRCFSNYSNLVTFESLLNSNRPQARAIAARMTVNLLAGNCVESIIEGDEGDWLYWMEEEMHESEDATNSDIARTIQIVKSIYPNQLGRESWYLNLIRSWTEELFAEPSVWAMAEAVANRLLTTDFLPGYEIFRICDSLNEDKVYIAPACSLGRRWRRRFGLQCDKRPEAKIEVCTESKSDSKLKLSPPKRKRKPVLPR